MDFSIVALIALLASSIRIATPLALAGMGETVSEKAGILNIGLEGMMLMGAFTGFLTTFFTDNILLGALAGILTGIAFSLLHAVLSIEFKADQTIVGLALNFLALGLTSFVFLKIFGQSTVLPSCRMISGLEIPLLSNIPFVGEILFSQDIVVYFMLFTAVLLYIFMNKTQWGIHLTAVGMYPRAADTVGISVRKVRYLAATVNGFLSGLAGAYLVFGQLGFFMENLTSGKGYIALVAVILGRRNPFGVLLATIVFGFANALQFSLQTMGWNIPSQTFSMLPYVVTVIALLFSIGKSSDPSALGQPYERDQR